MSKLDSLKSLTKLSVFVSFPVVSLFSIVLDANELLLFSEDDDVVLLFIVSVDDDVLSFVFDIVVSFVAFFSTSISLIKVSFKSLLSKNSISLLFNSVSYSYL